MTKTEKELITAARKKYGDIRPIKGKRFDKRSFTREGNIIIFWFHDRENSCHIIKREV